MNPVQKIWDYLEKLYLESKNPTVIEIVFTLFFYIISYVTLIEKFGNLISARIDFIYKIIISGLLLLLAITLTFLIRKLRLFRIQIHERNKFIEFFVNKQDPSYIIDHFTETHEIKENGDADYRREVTLEYHNEVVPWYEMYMGSTNDNVLGNNYFRIKVISSINHKSLANLPYKYEGSKIFIAVILNPTLSPENKKSGLIITRKWKRIWTDLVNRYDDEGNINIKYLTKRLEINFILPKKFEFTVYDVRPRIGRWKLTYNQNNHHSLSLIAEHVKPGKYQYNLSIRRLP
jgi:hypothetical protein